MDPTVKLSISNEDILHDATPYRRLIGKLLYLTISRLNITFAVHKPSQFMTKPTLSHMNATNYLVSYLKESFGKGIMLPKVKDFYISTFTDANWSSCPDTRRSVTGFCVFIGNSLVSWKSKKQQTVARTSVEAKYRALAVTIVKLYGFEDFLMSYRLKLHIQLSCFVIIKLPSTLQIISCFMSEPNTSSWTAILFGIE